MSKFRLHFLVRCDEIHKIREFVANLLQVSSKNIILKEIVVPNICVIHAVQIGEEVVKRIRNLNIKVINSEIADMLKVSGNKTEEVKELLKHFKNIAKRENFDFLLNSMEHEAEKFAW